MQLIAEDAGLSSLSNLNRRFRAVGQTTPREFQRYYVNVPTLTVFGKGKQSVLNSTGGDCSVYLFSSAAGQNQYAWAFWKEGNALVLREAGAKPRYAKSSLTQSRRYLHLNKDVVASDAELNGSTYLVTRDWVKKTSADCKEHGDQFVIRKRGEASV